jgi:hypothetical protein
MKEPVGRVYVLTNPRMQGLVKIGFTLGTVEGRAKELDATGTPEPFEIAYQVEVRGPESLERRAHSLLTGYRVRNSREFFEVDVIEAILCVRNLAAERLDEECHPKFIEMVDESARRRAEEREKQILAEKAREFEQFDLEASELQDKKKRLKHALEELQAKSNNSPPMVKFSWIEDRGLTLLLLLGLVFLIICIVAFAANNFLFSGLSAVIAAALLISWRQIKSISQKKKEHNLPIFLLEREIFNLKFDLQKLEGQKIYLPTNLSEFVTANPILVDDRGFERAARLDSRRR